MFLVSIILITVLYLCNKIYYHIEYYQISKKYTAVIVEPREHKALEFVLLNFLNNLDDQWKFIIFHGTKNKEYVENIINKYPEHLSKIKLINLGVDNLQISDYNKLLYSEEFYNNIDTEVFLVFQTDSMICNENKDLINNFIKYDYVGAPWNDQNIGNGGLSLRRKTKMLEILKNCPVNISINEDIFFSYGCENYIPFKPSFEESKKFSVETVFSDVSFGQHKSWDYLQQYIDNMKNNCQNYDKLIEYNS